MNNDQRKTIDLYYKNLIDALKSFPNNSLIYFLSQGTLNDAQINEIQSVKGPPETKVSSLLQMLCVVDKGWSSLINYLRDNNMLELAKKLEDSLDTIQKDTKGTGSTATTSTDEKSPAMKETTSAAAVSMENTSFRIEHRKRTMPNDNDSATSELKVKSSADTKLKRAKLHQSVCWLRTMCKAWQPEVGSMRPFYLEENSGTGVLVEIKLKDCVKRGILTAYKMFSYHRPYNVILISLDFLGEPSLALRPFQFELDDNAYVFACEFLKCSFAELRDEDVTRLKETRGCHFLNVHPFDLDPVHTSYVIAASREEVSERSDALPFNNVFHFYSNVKLQVGSPVVDNECNVVGMYNDYGWRLFYNSTATMSSHIMSAIGRDYESSIYLTQLPGRVASLPTDVMHKLESYGLLNTNTTNTRFIQYVSLSHCRFWKAVESMLGASAYRKMQKSHSVTISNMLQREKQQVSQKDKEGILVAMAIKAFLWQYDPTLRNFKHVKVGYDIEWLLRDLVAILTDLVDHIIANTGMIVVEFSAIIKNKELLESYRFEDTGADSAKTLCKLLELLSSFLHNRDTWLLAKPQIFALLSGMRELLFIDLCIMYSQIAVSNRPNEPASLKLVEKIQHQRTHHSWYWRAKYKFRVGESEKSSTFGPWHRHDVFPESDSERDANQEVYDTMRQALQLLKKLGV